MFEPLHSLTIARIGISIGVAGVALSILSALAWFKFVDRLFESKRAVAILCTPITAEFSKSGNYSFKFMLSSGDDEEFPGCKLEMCVGKYRVIFSLPPFILPGVCKVRGQYNYDELIDSRYGVYLFENHFNLCYGRGDANFNRDIFGEEQRWSCFLPWNEWRHVRHSLLDLRGYLFYWQYDSTKFEPPMDRYERMREMEAKCPKAVFNFKDFDGEEIQATTHLEELKWLRGNGWFKWLSFFFAPKIRRSLDIQFSEETGKRKGSWKGGTIGHGIDTLPDELHDAAFRRYCEAHDMTFIGRVA